MNDDRAITLTGGRHPAQLDRAIMLAYALKYASIGWHVFPVNVPLFNHPTGYQCSCEFWRHKDSCRDNPAISHYFLQPGDHCSQPGKCPRGSWSAKSTTDASVIQEWFTGKQPVNIGIDCGKSNLLVLDLDTYKATYGGMGRLSERDMQTVRQISGGGGIHLVYDRQMQPWGNSTRNLPPGIDVRGEGGYIVAAPSLHRSGKTYKWAQGLSPFSTRLLPVPGWLGEVLDGSRLPEGLIPDPDSVERSRELVDRVLIALPYDHSDWEDWNGGIRLRFMDCPFTDASPFGAHKREPSAFVVIRADGMISAGCHHQRCRDVLDDAGQSGWQFLKEAGLQPVTFINGPRWA